MQNCPTRSHHESDLDRQNADCPFSTGTSPRLHLSQPTRPRPPRPTETPPTTAPLLRPRPSRPHFGTPPHSPALTPVPGLGPPHLHETWSSWGPVLPVRQPRGRQEQRLSCGRRWRATQRCSEHRRELVGASGASVPPNPAPALAVPPPLQCLPFGVPELRRCAPTALCRHATGALPGQRMPPFPRFLSSSP